jgi:hypothetical protein
LLVSSTNRLLNEIMLIIIISINNIHRSIILVGYLGSFTVKGTKSLVDYSENYISSTLKNHQWLSIMNYLFIFWGFACLFIKLI